VPLDDAERVKLEEIERQLEREKGDLARTFRTYHRVRRELALPILGAAAVFLAALTALSVVTGSPVPVLLSLPAVAGTVLLLRWPHLFRMVPAERPRRPPSAAGP
jgi:hypothetical protein